MSVQLYFQGPSGGTGGKIVDPSDPHHQPQEIDASNPPLGATASVTLATEDCRISELIVRAGSSIDAIAASYVGSFGNPLGTLEMGGKGGTEWVIQLAAEEYLIQVDCYYSNVVHWIQLTTNLKKGYAFGGTGGGGINSTYNAPPGYMIIGFWGGAGSLIDRLGVIFRTIPNSK